MVKIKLAWLSPEEQDFCKYLDSNFSNYQASRGNKLEKSTKLQKKKHSDLFSAGLYSFRMRDLNNKDIVSQAANSIREIFYNYSVFCRHIVHIRKSELTPQEVESFGKLYGYFTKGAHHGANFDESKFEENITTLQKTIRAAIEKTHSSVSDISIESEEYMNIFKEINQIILNGPRKEVNISTLNEKVYRGDGNIYWHFFVNLTPIWLPWLNKHGFLEEKINTSDPQDYNSGTGEMTFIERSVKSNPMRVADVLMKIKDPQNLSNHIIRIFLNICIDLPKDEFSRLIPKVLDENWLYVYYKKGYANDQYKKIMTRLLENKDYHNYALKVCETALTFKEVEDRSKSTLGNYKNEDFIIDMLDIREIGIFSYLLDLTMKGYLDKVLSALISKTNKLIFDYNQAMQGDNSEHTQVSRYGFKCHDPLGIASTDVSFIDDKIEMPMYTSNHDGLKYLMFILNKALSEEIIKNKVQASSIYQKHINDFKYPDAKLVDSPATWRLRLHLISLAPDEFKEESKKLLFHLFKKEAFYYAIQSEEYFIALKNNFHTLETVDQEKYIDGILHIYKSYNGKPPDYIKDNVCNVLGMLEKHIKTYPSIQEKLNAQDISPNYEYKPIPNDCLKITGGWSSPVAPLDEKEFSEISIPDIAKKLRTEWSAEELDKKNSSENFMNPSYVSSVGRLLESDIPNRFSGYCEHAGLFFEENILNVNYTYYYLEGINKAIKNLNIKILEKDLPYIFNMCTNIIESEDNAMILKDVRVRGYKESITSMIRVLESILMSDKEAVVLYIKENRNIVIQITQTLLAAYDPLPREEESLESASSLAISQSGTKISDPFNIAINSIRGRAYQLFVNFMRFDSRASDTRSSVIIADDVKKIYEDLLQREETRAINFLFGHYLSDFYLRDKEWVRKLVPDIFTKNISKKHLYTAAWEGLLEGQLIEEMILDPIIQNVYLRGLDLTDEDFPSHQNHFVHPASELAKIIALAHIRFKALDVNHQLYKKFWEKSRTQSHKSFIEVIGGDVQDSSIKNNFWQERVKILWSSMLTNYTQGIEPIVEFGSFITLKADIFEIKELIKMVSRTLEKTGGRLSNYHPLRESIVEFAKQDPHETLKIIELTLARHPTQDEDLYDAIGGTGKQWVAAFHIIKSKIKNSKKGKKEYKEALGKLLKFHSGMFAEFVDK